MQYIPITVIRKYQTLLQQTFICGSNFLPDVLFNFTNVRGFLAHSRGVERSEDLASQAMSPKVEIMDSGSTAVKISLIHVLCGLLHTRGHGHRNQHPLLKSPALLDTMSTLRSVCSNLYYQLEGLLTVRNVIFTQQKALIKWNFAID
jgi:hypothetical protein